MVQSYLTTEVISCLIGAFGSFISSAVTITSIMKGNRYKYLMYTAVVWILFFFYNLFWGLCIFFESELLGLISFYLLVIEGLFVLVVADFLHRESLEPIKLAFYAVLATASYFISLNPNSIIQYTLPNGESSMKVSGLFGTFVLVTVFIPNLIFLFHVYRMNKEAPKELKFYSRLYLVGILLLLFVTNLVAISGLSLLIPGLHMIIGGFAGLIMSITLAKDPKIVFILPFKAYRLMIIETRGGMPLFTFDWVKKNKMSDEILYAGMLQGINLILMESVNKGEVREIYLKNAVLLINRAKTDPIACVLVATRSSSFLKDSLDAFTKQFCVNYKEYFNDFAKVFNFESAKVLVQRIFPFLPYYN